MVILTLLKTFDELSATELEAALGITHGAVSQHMRILQDAGMVKAQRRHRWTYYKLDPQVTGLLP
jgi:ArsR family transcriptional regulator